MANTPYKTFYDLPNTTTPLNATTLNNLQIDIKDQFDTKADTVDVSINSSTYVMTIALKSGLTTISSDTVDLPLESMVINGSYDSTNKKIILTLQSGSTIEFSVADLVSGLQSEITSNSKLSSDLVDDTNNTNKFVTASDKTTWNGKQDALVSGTNIKTINNESILGSGNITIQGGGGSITVHDSYSASTTEPYSCNYVNTQIGNIETLLSQI